MKFELNPQESILKEGAANLQKGIETVGGKLYLTTDRIVFEAHAFNFQTKSEEIDVANIKSAQPGWTKLIGIIPIFPNTLLIQTKNDREFSFVVFNRTAWTEAIQAIIK